MIQPGNELLTDRKPVVADHRINWSSPVVPEVWVETQTGVAKGQKVGRAEVIQTGVVYFQRYRCLSLSVSSVNTSEKADYW